MKYFTLESASLHSIPGRNVVSLQTSILVLQRPFISAFRGPLSRDIPSLEHCVFHSQYVSIAFIHTSQVIICTFHPTPSLHTCIYILRTQNIFSSLMMPLIDWRKLGFWILRPHQNSLIFFNYAAEEQHEQIKEIIFSLGRKNNILTKRKDFMAPQVMTDVKRPDQQT